MVNSVVLLRTQMFHNLDMNKLNEQHISIDIDRYVQAHLLEPLKYIYDEINHKVSYTDSSKTAGIVS